MSVLTVTAPAVLLVKNISDNKSAEFIPYRENFKVSIPAGQHILFPVFTSGQILYYFGQKYENLEVRIFDAETEQKMDMYIPIDAETGVEITLINNSNKVINFIPYKENFNVSLAPNDEIDLTLKNAGQVFYYMAQQTEGLEVDIPFEDIGVSE